MTTTAFSFNSARCSPHARELNPLFSNSYKRVRISLKTSTFKSLCFQAVAHSLSLFCCKSFIYNHVSKTTGGGYTPKSVRFWDFPLAPNSPLACRAEVRRGGRRRATCPWQPHLYSGDSYEVRNHAKDRDAMKTPTIRYFHFILLFVIAALVLSPRIAGAAGRSQASTPPQGSAPAPPANTATPAAPAAPGTSAHASRTSQRHSGGRHHQEIRAARIRIQDRARQLHLQAERRDSGISAR